MKIRFGLNKKNDSESYRLYLQSKDPTEHIQTAKEIISAEYSKYPQVIKKSGLSLVNLVGKLRVRNAPNSNIYLPNSQSVDPQKRWMYVDTSYVKNMEYFIESTNHEIWHLFEYAMTGEFNPIDSEWDSLNSPEFEYGKGGWESYQNKTFENRYMPQIGFITSYSMLGADEDKAEIFMYYFTDHLKSKLETAIENDLVLREKLNLIRNRIGEI